MQRAVAGERVDVPEIRPVARVFVLELVGAIAHQHGLDLAGGPVRSARFRHQIVRLDHRVIDLFDQPLIGCPLRLADINEQRHVPFRRIGLDHRLQFAVGGRRDVDDLDAGRRGEGVEEVLPMQRAGGAAPAADNQLAAGILCRRALRPGRQPSEAGGRGPCAQRLHESAAVHARRAAKQLDHIRITHVVLPSLR